MTHWPGDQRAGLFPSGCLSAGQGSAKAVVAIPAKDEVERIGDCIAALGAQRGAPPLHLVLFLNNCTDGTAAVAARAVAEAGLSTEIVEAELSTDRASAGVARSCGMLRAAELASPDAVLLTTDADSRPGPFWLANNLREIALGADAVAGRALIDPVEALLIPAALHEADAREVAYGELLDEIDSLIDPNPADPWPRHTEHSGASIAVTLAAYRFAGGMPAIPAGEDRAFFTALRRIGARIRHARDVAVVVSGRTEGRAKGGMADTIRRRISAPDLLLDEAFEPANESARRSRLRQLTRQVHAGLEAPGVLAMALEMPATQVIAKLGLGFGLAWEALETRSPVLRRRRVAVAELAAQTARAERLRDRLLSVASTGPADSADGALGNPATCAAGRQR